MLIPVTLSPSSTSNAKLPSGLVKISNDEIILVELQGSLEVEATHPSERNGKFVGKLKIDEATNKPSLLIGNHLLEGKIAVLPKPYAILVRNATKRGSTHSSSAMQAEGAEGDDDAMAVDDAPVDTDTGAGVGVDSELEPSAGWTIAGVVKKKIIFSKRPMPVIGKK